jgi:tRNA-2-methylthio-N6-dimethylallyladenosine synthase
MMEQELIELRRHRPTVRAGGASPGMPVLPTSRRVFVETYGCQMNLGDSELMTGVLAERGYVTVDRPESADVIVVNTCAIREHAEQRVRGRIGQLQ